MQKSTLTTVATVLVSIILAAGIGVVVALAKLPGYAIGFVTNIERPDDGGRLLAVVPPLAGAMRARISDDDVEPGLAVGDWVVAAGQPATDAEHLEADRIVKSPPWLASRLEAFGAAGGIPRRTNMVLVGVVVLLLAGPLTRPGMTLLAALAGVSAVWHGVAVARLDDVVLDLAPGSMLALTVTVAVMAAVLAWLQPPAPLDRLMRVVAFVVVVALIDRIGAPFRWDQSVKWAAVGVAGLAVLMPWRRVATTSPKVVRWPVAAIGLALVVAGHVLIAAWLMVVGVGIFTQEGAHIALAMTLLVGIGIRAAWRLATPHRTA